MAHLGLGKERRGGAGERRRGGDRLAESWPRERRRGNRPVSTEMMTPNETKEKLQPHLVVECGNFEG